MKNLLKILSKANASGNFIRIDMEDFPLPKKRWLLSMGPVKSIWTTAGLSFNLTFTAVRRISSVFYR